MEWGEGEGEREEETEPDGFLLFTEGGLRGCGDVVKGGPGRLVGETTRGGSLVAMATVTSVGNEVNCSSPWPMLHARLLCTWVGTIITALEACAR